MYNNQTVNIYETGSEERPNIMRTDIQEKEGSYLLEIEIPGYSKEDVKAELVDGMLTIVASKRDNSLEQQESKINYIRKERIVGTCKRSFYVGKKIRQEDITAAFKDGVLSIIITNPEKAVDREEIKLIPIQ